MDKNTYEETAKRLKAVSRIVSDLDPAIRADGWAILMPYVTDDPMAPTEADGTTPRRRQGVAGALNIDALIENHASDDAPGNALLVAAILYGKYGLGPYAAKDFRALGDEHHLLMPLLSNFLPRTKRDDGRVFRKRNDGWLITTHGARWLSATYDVKRGTEPKPE